nr:hypothetical protein [Tanacetum cinerariifolium]
MLFRPIMNDSK